LPGEIIPPRGYEPLTRAQVRARATPLAPLCGVYFLLLGDEIVYVGKSANVHKRIHEHARAFKFDAVAIEPCEPFEASMIEVVYLAKFRPINNRIGHKVAAEPYEAAA